MRRVFVVGLRNYLPQYSGTRHNVGAAALFELAKTNHLVWTSRGDADQAEWPEHNATLVLPRTYMNLSGGPVAKLFPKRNLAGEDLIVVHDELELALGKVKVKAGGSAKGHNGIKSIIENLGGVNNFKRVQVGIDRPASRDGAAVSLHVLSKFTKAEQDNLNVGLYEAGVLITQLLKDRKEAASGAAPSPTTVAKPASSSSSGTKRKRQGNASTPTSSETNKQVKQDDKAASSPKATSSTSNSPDSREQIKQDVPQQTQN